MTPTEFTPLESAIGGALIGLAAVFLMLTSGRVAGISTIVRRLIPPYREARPVESAAFLAGLIGAPLVWQAAAGTLVSQTVSASQSLYLVAGLLVGFGAILGGGCTSGHGVCGLARLSRRSLAATLVFMATAIATVFVTRHIVGGWPWA